MRLLDLGAAESRYRNTAVDPLSVRDRILAAPSSPDATVPAVTSGPAVAEALDADVVFVDWADKGLSLVTEQVPDGTRVVVRLHGVDTLSAWLAADGSPEGFAPISRLDDLLGAYEELLVAYAAATGAPREA